MFSAILHAFRRRALAVFAAAFLVGGASALYAIADEVQKITISNQIGKEVKLLFVSPGDSSFWGPDILGNQRTLGMGQSLDFYLHYPEACGKFDLLALDAEGKAYAAFDHEVCDSEPSALTLEAASRNEAEDRPLAFSQVTFHNQTGVTIAFLFISPADSEMWGADFLDANSRMAPDASRTFLAPPYQEAARYNVLAVSESGDFYGFNIELEGDGAVTYPIEPGDLQEQ